MKSKTISNIGIYTTMAFLQKGMAFFMIPMFISFLTPEEFGIVTQIITLGAFYILFFNFGLDEAAVRYYFENRNNLKESRKLLGNILIMNSVIIIIGITFLLIFNKYCYLYFIDNLPFKYVFLSIVIVFFSPFISIYQKQLKIKEKAVKYSVLLLLYSFLQMFLSILFVVVLKLHAYGYLLAYAISPCVFGVYSLYKLLNSVDLKFDKKVSSEVFKYSIAIVPHLIFSWGTRSFTIIALGKFLNSKLVGIFNAMNYLSLIIDVLATSFINAYQPWAYRQFESGKSGEKRFVEMAYSLGIIFTLGSFFLSLISVDLMNFVINPRYHIAMYLAPVLIYSSINLFFGSLFEFVLFYYKKHTKYIGIASCIGAIVNISLCLFLIPLWGLLGSAISLAISNLLISLLKQYFSRLALGMNTLFIDLFIITIVNCIVSTLMIYYHNSLGMRLGVFLIEFFLFLLIFKKEVRKMLNFANDIISSTSLGLKRN